MARFKNYLFVVMGFAVAGVIGAAFGTGTAQAIVATLVEVVNPSTSPVPSLNVTDPGRIAYQATVNNTGKCSSPVCFFVFPAVPSGHRVVIQHISGGVNFTGVPTSLFVLIQGPRAINISGFFAPTPVMTFSLFEEPVLLYVDGGSFVNAELSVIGTGVNFAGGGAAVQFVTIDRV
jgi:hypothetical protein